MKKTIFTLVLGFLATGLFAQDLVYTHDANGNRIVRETIFLKTANPANGNPATAQNQAQQEALETYLLGNPIVVYPNPTAGKIVLETTSAEALSGATILLFDANGRHLQQLIITTTQTDIDLTAYANGVYIVRLTYQGRTKEWRVVKQ